MPTNKFEKQVQKQLEEFQLSPSATVWNKVEEQIREKKRRRIIFFYILPAAVLLLLGLGFYQFIYSNGNTETIEPAAHAKKENSAGDQTNVPATTSKQSTASAEQKTNSTTGTNTNQQPATGSQQPATGSQQPATGNQNISPRRKLQKQQDDAMVVTSDIPVPVKQQVTGVDQKTAIVTQKTDIVNDKTVAPIDTKDIVVQNTGPDKSNQPAETVVKQDAAVKTDNDKTTDIAVVDDKKDAPAKTKSGWPQTRWGIDFFAGLTSTQTGIFSLEKSMAADMMAGGPPTTGSGGPVAPQPPSSLNNGPSFRIGVAAEMQVSDRSRFSTGIQYAYASTRMNTGARTDTMIVVQTNNSYYTQVQVDRIYRGIPSSTYTNKFHFISIPLWYHLQVNKGKKLPIQWDIGMSANYLVSTNALVYSNYIGGIYYEDKQLFTKMHFNLGTGLSFRFKSKNSSEWTVGPSVLFGLNSVAKDEEQYLMYGGINARFLFPKKKNK